MELKDYVVSFIYEGDRKRHFMINNITLCGKRNSRTYYDKVNVTDPSNVYAFLSYYV